MFKLVKKYAVAMSGISLGFGLAVALAILGVYFGV